jgi:SAM-dependent methyltransferase
MLALARQAAAERLAPSVAARFATEVAPADELPFEDGRIDHAVSSFVLQLVRSRAAALREVRRVLRPGGTFAWAAWQTSDVPYEPDRIANDELDQAGFDPPEGGGRPGDIASAEAAAAGMRRAGFREVRAHVTELAHAWDPAGYLAFFTQFDEESLFTDLEPSERLDIERRIRRRLERLTPEQLTLRMPVIYVTGRAPG